MPQFTKNSQIESVKRESYHSTNSVARFRLPGWLRGTVLMVYAITSLTVILTATGVAQAQDLRLKVEVGNNNFYSFQKQIDRYEPIVVKPARIARAWFRENRIYVEGLAPGVATITFKGMYRRIIVGSEIRENPKPFRYEIQVVVSAAQADVRPTIKNYRVSQRTGRTTQLEHFLGSPFGNTRQREDWIANTPTSSNPNIASAEFVNTVPGSLAVRISGVGSGRATIVLSGQRRVNNSWQRVTRSIEVVVAGRNTNTDYDENNDDSGGNGNPSPGGPTKEAVTALESMYADNKSLYEQIGSQEEKRRAIEAFNKVGFLVKQLLESERRSNNPRAEILSRLNALLKSVADEIKRLEKTADNDSHTDKDKAPSLAGTWNLFYQGNKVRAGYRIDTKNTAPNIRADLLISKGNQPWFFANAVGDVFTGYEIVSQNELGLGTNMIQLRGRGSRQLDIWKIMKVTDVEFQFTGYSLVREDR